MYRYLFFIVCIALISALFFLNINNKSRVIEIGNIQIDKNPYKIISVDSVNKMLKLEINSNKIKFKRDLNLKEIETLHPIIQIRKWQSTHFRRACSTTCEPYDKLEQLLTELQLLCEKMISENHLYETGIRAFLFL